MSFYFIVNNIHFALELFGALAFFIMGWLAIDSYKVDKHYSSISKGIGFALVGVWQIIYAFGLQSDAVNFSGFIFYILGLLLILSSFVFSPRIAAVTAVLFIPSFVDTLPSLEIISTVVLALLTYFSFSQMKKEFNASAKPLFVGFLFLTLASLSQLFSYILIDANIFWYIGHFFEALSFLSFAFWTWQYMRLRIRESLMLIMLSLTLVMATVVTLAFSTILMIKIEGQTRNSLLVDAKIFDLSIDSLKDRSLADAKLISSDQNIQSAISSNDSVKLQSSLAKYIDSENLGLLLVTDKSGTVILRAHLPNEFGDSISNERAVEEALIGNSFATIEYSDAERFSIRASSPIYDSGKIVGTIVAGFPLDNVMVDGIKKVTNLDSTIYRGNVAVASTILSEDGRGRLTDISIEDKSIKDNVLGKGQTATTRITIKGTPFLASYLPIIDGDNNIVGMISASKPQSEILEIANSTNRLTLITVSVILLILILPIYFVTKELFESVN